jgi:hypothetical protein
MIIIAMYRNAVSTYICMCMRRRVPRWPSLVTLKISYVYVTFFQLRPPASLAFRDVTSCHIVCVYCILVYGHSNMGIIKMKRLDILSVCGLYESRNLPSSGYAWP